VQKLIRKDNGELALLPVDQVADQFNQRRKLMIEEDTLLLQAGSRYNYTEVFTCFESFKLTGKFTYTGKGSFGLVFDYNGQPGKYKMISLDPASQTIQLLFNEGGALITETAAALEKDREYSFTYIQEGSVGIFYLDDLASLTVRLYGVSGKPIRLYAENNTVTFTDLREYTR